MLRRNFIIFSLLSFSISLSGCGGGGSSSDGGGAAQPTAQPSSQTVVAIGDSIGTGFGIATPWPPRLESLIGRVVVNNSISGEETDFGLINVERLIDENNPSHVVVLLGTNDAIRGSVSGAIANLQSIVDIARSRNVIPIIGTLPPLTNSTAQNARAAQISNGIRGLNGAVVAEVRGALGDGNGTIADGIHPNNTGQQIIAETFASVF